eukprot:gene7359-15026_t
MITQCPYCNSTDVVTDHAAGDIICRDCATIITDRIIENDAEWRVYADDDRGNKASSARAESRSDDTGLQRTQLIGGKSVLRKALTKSHMETAFTKNESSTVANMSLLMNLGCRLGLQGNVTDRAKTLLHESMKKKLFAPVDKLPLLAAVLYVASRMQGCPLWIGYVAHVLQVDSKKIGRLLSVLRTELQIDPGRVVPELLVPRIASMLKIAYSKVHTAREACKKISEQEMLGSTAPQVVAVVILLVVELATGGEVDVDKAAQTALVSPELIRKVYATVLPLIPHILEVELKAKRLPLDLSKLPPTLQLKKSIVKVDKVSVTSTSSSASTPTALDSLVEEVDKSIEPFKKTVLMRCRRKLSAMTIRDDSMITNTETNTITAEDDLLNKKLRISV